MVYIVHSTCTCVFQHPQEIVYVVSQNPLHIIVLLNCLFRVKNNFTSSLPTMKAERSARVIVGGWYTIPAKLVNGNGDGRSNIVQVQRNFTLREVAENCALVGYYAASNSNFLPTSRDTLTSTRGHSFSKGRYNSFATFCAID